VGDAVCSFNPTYGQGMTVVAAQAVALRDCLERGARDLARRFFSAANVPVDHAWQLSVGADLALPEVIGRPPARVRLINAYLGRLRATAEHDPAVAAAFTAVIGMTEAPRHALRPAIAARVARGPRPGAWSERVDGVRLGGLRTPLREAGPPDASEAVVFLHGNPGSSADWAPLLAAAGRRWRAVARPPQGLAAPPLRSGFGRPSRHMRSSSVARSTRSGSSASTSSHTTSVGPGASLGRPASPTGSPARSCSAPDRSRATAGMRSPGCGARRTPVSCS
jgi:hypothetical protein